MVVDEATTAHEQHHLAHSHAREEDIPGTVNLSVAAGDDTGYGQALFPVPAEDPNDPLQWSNVKKTLILAICALYSFLGNSALLGPSVYITIFAEEFGISPNKASGLISYANLAFGFGEFPSADTTASMIMTLTSMKRVSPPGAHVPQVWSASHYALVPDLLLCRSHRCLPSYLLQRSHGCPDHPSRRLWSL